MSNASDGLAVCVAGMHRSGTSMVARILSECGVYLGESDELLPPAKDNVAGHFEHQEFVQLNDDVLATLGGAWDVVPPRYAIWRRRRLEPLRARAASLVERMRPHAPWRWKDPRTSLTLPFWLDVDNLLGYQHVHPKLRADGTWSVPLKLSTPGAYRAFADFDVHGEKTVLGRDLFVPGRFTPLRLPATSLTASSDGYAIELKRAELHAGEETKLHFVVRRNGRPVPSFERYVGHRGHLVALRAGDLSYSHVHPEPDGGPGEIVFHTELPTAGAYRLFMQFKLDGVVHTSAFTVWVKR